MRCSSRGLWFGLVLVSGALAGGLLVGDAVSQKPADSDKPAASQAPWQRLLTGEDAKRVENLEAKLAKLQEAGAFSEAVAVAQEVLEVRRQRQGADHWQTVDAGWDLKTLRKLAAGQTADQQEWILSNNAAKEAAELFKKGRYAEAQPLYQKALDLRRKLLGEEYPDTASSYNDLGYNLQYQGRYAEAQPLFQKTLDLRLKLLGENHPDTAAAYNSLALDIEHQGRYAEAQPLFRKAFDLRLTLLGENHPDTAESYNNLAFNLGHQGRYAEAQSLFQKTLDLYRKLRGENHLETARSYNNLAYILDAQGRYAEAQPLHQKVLDLHRQLLGEDHPTTAISYQNLASNLAGQGRHAEALPLYEKALAVYVKRLGEDHPTTAQGYNNLAGTLDAQGRHAEALPLHQKALTLYLKRLGEDHPATARSYTVLAENLRSQGRYAEALPLHQKALTLYLKRLGEDHPDTAQSYSFLAESLRSQGRYIEAQPLAQKALDLNRKLLGEKHPATAGSYADVAHNLADQGQYARAQPLFQKALDLLRTVFGEDHPETARSYSNLASNLQAQGRYAEAQPLFQKALALNRKLVGENHPDIATSYNNLAANLHFQGRYAEAQPLLLKALDLRRQFFGENHPVMAGSYGNLAFNLYAQGKYDQVEGLLVAAARGYTEARRGASFSGAARANVRELAFPLLPLLAAVSARNGKPVPAWSHLEEDLGRGLRDDLAARQLAVQKLTPPERQRRHDLVATVQRQEKLFQRSPSRPGDNVEDQKRWADLTRHYQEAQTALAQFQADLAQKYKVAVGPAYDLARIQAQLPADAALLTWVDVHWKGLAKAADPNGEHWACLVRAKGTPIWERLPGSGPGGTWTKADDDLRHRLRRALAKHQDDSQELAQQLYAQRLAPLEKYLGPSASLPAVRQLIVLPVRRMAGVPIEALTERYTISYAPSGTLFAKLREGRAITAPVESPQLLALGDPAFASPVAEPKAAPRPPDHGVLLTMVQRSSNAERAGLKAGDVLLRYAGTQLANAAALRQAIGRQKPNPDRATRSGQTVSLTVWRDGQTLELAAAPGPLGVTSSKDSAAAGSRARRDADALLRGLRGDALRPLPGSRAEVQAIASLFPQADTLLGSDASEQRLDELAAQGRLRSYRYLHFATHGRMNDGIPLQSSLALAQDHLPDPLAQVQAGKKVYDGRLTAEQILQSWQLDADLVTLSACESGLGRQGAGDGYIGFAQVLFLAGTRSLVLSLWEVDDTATALLMTRFYQNLLGQRAGLAGPLAKAEALREAKHWLRTLNAEEAARLKAQLPGGARGEQVVDPLPAPATAHPYEHPYYWAAFILLGDPGEPSVPAAHSPSPRSLNPWYVSTGLVVGAWFLSGIVVWRRWRTSSQPRVA